MEIIKRGDMTLHWNPGPLTEAIRKAMAARLTQAADHLATAVKRSISTSSKGGRSRPGEPPHAETGRLRNSIHYTIDPAKLTGKVGSPLEYASHLEFGTKGGTIIRPIRARALSWIDQRTGNRVFARRVRQGPIQARPFLRPALASERGTLLRILTAPLRPNELPGK